MSDKTEQPTAKKLKDARKQGQLPRSRMLSASGVSVGALLGMSAGSSGGTNRLVRWTERLFVEQSATVDAAAAEGLTILAWLSLPALLGAVFASFAVSAATAGVQFNGTAIAPKFDRVSPLEGFKRLFSVRQLVDAGKGLLLVVVLGLVLWSAASALETTGIGAVNSDAPMSFATLLRAMVGWMWRGLLVVVAFGVADYALARRRHRRDLMMTKEEVKKEHKETEGDPQQKGRRKAMHRQLAAGGPARGVQKATAIVVNPTHIAVALRYEPSECEAPYIVAKGREDDAFAIRREAKAAGIPVVKDIPLARSLIHFDVGEEIPEELYRAAAVVLKVASESRD